MSSLTPPKYPFKGNEKPPPKNKEVFDEELVSPHERSDEYYETLFQALVSEAPNTPGNAAPLVPIENIEWFNEELSKESCDFRRKYFFNIVLSHVTSHLLFYCVKNTSKILKNSGRHADPKEIRDSLFFTVKKIDELFKFQCERDEYLHSFEVVRDIFTKSGKDVNETTDSSEENQKGLSSWKEPWKEELASAIRNDLAHIDTEAPKNLITWNPPLNNSQFDLSMQLFSSIFTMWFSASANTGSENDGQKIRDLKAFIHTWAIIGRLLGLKDEFNICFHLNSTFYDLLFRNVIVESLKNLDEPTITMQCLFVDAVRKCAPFSFVTYKSLLFLSMDGWGNFRGENLWKLMSWRDKISLGFLRWLRWLVKHLALFRFLINRGLAWYLSVQFWYSPSQESLFKKYSFPFY